MLPSISASHSCACRSYDSAFFVWRKVAPEPAPAVLMEGISYDASTEQIDAWIKSYIAALDQTDPETEDGEPGELRVLGSCV